MRGHAFDVKSQRFTIWNSLHAEVEPSVVVALASIWKRITRHVASEGVGRSIFGRVAPAEVSRVKGARNDDATWERECILLRLSIIDRNIIVKLKRLFQIALTLLALN